MRVRDGDPTSRSEPDDDRNGGVSAASNGDSAVVGNGLTRVTVNLSRQAVQALEAVSEGTGYSKTDTINRALQLYAIVQEIMRSDGGVLRVKHDDGTIERIHIV